MPEEYIVEMNHITKKFPGIVANDDITIHIKKGEIYALLGENGAGKSTLMSMLFGMYEPDAGEIKIRGKAVTLSSSYMAAALNIGMVHQHFKLVHNYTVTENIILGVEPIKRIFGFIPYVDIKGASQHILELSKSYGMEVDPDALISSLPVSSQQRVEILKMLYRNADILIFDEPTAVLTPQEIAYLLHIMDELRHKGKTIILITHKLEEIKKIADRCAILLHGKLVTILNVAETPTHEMARLMVGRTIAPNLKKKQPQAGKVILEVSHLTVQNENAFEVVKDVSFSIHAGEIFAIAGVSGNGQVELADAIYGQIKAASGTIVLAGKDITKQTVRRRIESGVSYIPEDRQRFGLVMDFMLQDNLAIKTYYKPEFSHKSIIKKRVFEEYGQGLIEKYDIRSGQGIYSLTRSMSGGNQQKAIIGREITLDSPFLIFVQPTRGLDVGAIDHIHRQILAERDKGKGILLISLELEEIMALADRIAIMYNGELLKTAEAASLSIEEVGKYMMGIKN